MMISPFNILLEGENYFLLFLNFFFTFRMNFCIIEIAVFESFPHC